MSTCSSCTPEITAMVLATCTPVTAPGGIRTHGVMKCSVEFSDVSGGQITDPEAWEAFKESGDIIFFGHVVGSKAKGTDTNTRIASCLPEVKTGSQKVISIRDYNDDPDNYTQYASYKSIEDNYASLNWFYITCDERVFFYNWGTWTAAIDDVRPETKEEPAFVDFVVTVNEIGMKTPIHVPGILDIL